jgi:hypothetical protein
MNYIVTGYCSFSTQELLELHWHWSAKLLFQGSKFSVKAVSHAPDPTPQVCHAVYSVKGSKLGKKWLMHKSAIEVLTHLGTQICCSPEDCQLALLTLQQSCQFYGTSYLHNIPNR